MCFNNHELTRYAFLFLNFLIKLLNLCSIWITYCILIIFGLDDYVRTIYIVLQLWSLTSKLLELEGHNFIGVVSTILIFGFVNFSDQAEARRNKVKEARKRRDERQTTKRQEVLKIYAKEDEVEQK